MVLCFITKIHVTFFVVYININKILKMTVPGFECRFKRNTTAYANDYTIQLLKQLVY